MKLLLATVATGAMACAAARPDARPIATTITYTFALTPDARALVATVCFDGRVPSRLDPPVAMAAPLLRRAVHLTRDGAADLAADPDGISLAFLTSGACVRYDVSLAVDAGPLQVWGVRSRDGTEGLASTRLWLWRPTPFDARTIVRARFETPDALHLSLPWRAAGDGAFVLDETAFSREGYVAWSRTPPSHIDVPGGAIDVLRLDGAREADAWLRRSARAVSALFGEFPATHTQVMLLGRGREDGNAGYSDTAVPYAFTSHAAGESVLFMLWRDATDEGVARDTTALHEFVHLGQPVMRDEDAWLFEGIATWYEKVLAVRGGFTTERDAWRWYLDGFDRGRDDQSGRALAEDSAGLYVDHHVSRVYWAGVAFAMTRDVAVRRETQGRRSLDDAVRALHACCEGRTQTYTADDALAVMDVATGTGAFTSPARTYLAARDFPDVTATLTALGVTRHDGEVTLDDHAPDAALRHAIFAMPSP